MLHYLMLGYFNIALCLLFHVVFFHLALFFIFHYLMLHSLMMHCFHVALVVIAIFNFVLF